ncbi:MAG: glycosyltransferase [Bacteroidales bacterium]|nr:glycosyltransferase [Bacteroidales bacterium]
MTNNLAIICCTNDLLTDKRVNRTCMTFLEENYNVILVGRKLKHSKNLKRPYKTCRFKLLFNKKFLFYAEYNIRLFFYLIIKRPFLVVANDLDTLPACYLASKLTNAKLVYDSHEYFTEVPELNNRKFVKKIWLFIEKSIIPKLKNAITVCDSIANIYFEKYGIEFNVIRNIPEYRENKKLKYDFTKDFGNNAKYILLYQGALNIGRGLEKLIQSIKYLPEEYVIAIIGSGDIEKKLTNIVEENNLTNRIKFYGRIDVNDLPYYTSGATVGFSLEQNISKNYYFALPNKIFDYIHANVPVICSNFPEMENIISTYNCGITVDSNISPEDLAEVIKKLIENKRLYDLLKENCEKASKDLNWNTEKEKLKKIIKAL